MEKRIVPVIVRFDENGQRRPLEIQFDESHHYKIDKILDKKRAACQEVGGVGIRYTCQIAGKVRPQKILCNRRSSTV